MPRETATLIAPEAAVLKACRAYLTVRRIYHWRQNSGAVVGVHNGTRRFIRFTSESGVSDLVGILPDGRFLAIEVKAGRNQPSAAQAAFLARINATGGLGLVVWSVDDLIAGLTKAGY